MSYYFNPHGHQCPWYPYSELLGYPSANWCEQVSCFWISEPISTYSSLSFILIASILFGSLNKKNHPDLKLYLNLLLLIGVGTALYHVSLNYAAQLLSHGLIYAFFGSFVVKNLIRQAKLGYSKQYKYLIGYTAFMLVIEHILYSNFLTTQILVPLNFLVVLITEIKSKKYESQSLNYTYLVLGFILILIAEASSMIDLFKIYCNPKSMYFHGHALWHVLAAISFGFLYMHQFQLYPLKEGYGEDDEDEEEELEEIEVKEHLNQDDKELSSEEEEIKEELQEIHKPQFDSMLDLSEEPELDEDESEEEESVVEESEEEEIQDSHEDQQEPNEEEELPSPSGVYTSEELPTQFGSLEDDEDEEDKKD